MFRTIVMAFMLVGAALAGCADAIDTTLKFDPTGPVGATPYPNDNARTQVSGVWLLNGYNQAQLESMAFLDQLRIGRIDGYSATTRIRIPFTEAGGNHLIKVDIDTAERAIRLYDVTGETAARHELAEFRLRPTTSAVTCRPATPLTAGHTYGVAVLTNTLETRGGGRARASDVYASFQSAGDPATDAGFDKVRAVDPDINGRTDTVGYFQFTVRDNTGPLTVLRDALSGLQEFSIAGERELLTITSYADPDRRLAIEGRTEATEATAVAALFGGLPSDGVGSVVRGSFSGPNIMSDYDGSDVDALWTYQTVRGENIDAPFSAQNPPQLSASNPYRPLPYLAFLPATWPQRDDGALAPIDVVVALHGFGGSKEDWFSVANTITSSGMALIAIDAYQHGERQGAVAYPEGDTFDKIDVAVEQLMPGAGFPDPFLNPTFLSRTRAKFLQTAVDVLSIVELLAAADGTHADIDFNGDLRADTVGSIHLLGMSLGSMLATVIAGVSPHIERVAAYAPGGGLADLARDSEVLGLPLTLLMLATSNTADFGLLRGIGADGEAGSTVMLIDRPEREVYGIVVDALMGGVDPLNYAQSMMDGSLRGDGGARVLMQLTDFDLVIPNNASDRLVRAMIAGAGPGEVGVIDNVDRPKLFEMSSPTASDPSGVRAAITHWSGPHGVLLDWLDPATTATAQSEVANFLTAP